MGAATSSARVQTAELEERNVRLAADLVCDHVIMFMHAACVVVYVFSVMCACMRCVYVCGTVRKSGVVNIC